MAYILRGVLRPFLENADLLRAMCVDGHSSVDGVAAADATATGRPTGIAGRSREGETRGGGEWSPPPSAGTPPNAAATTAPAEENGESCEDGRAAGDCPWGYRSSLSLKGCWKVESWAAARRDSSVELGFDSAAFDVFVRPEDESGEAAVAAGRRPAAAAVVTNVVPFRLADGLPRELGPLLFDKSVLASLLAGDAEHRPPSRDGGKRRKGKHTGTTEREGADSSPGETPEDEETEEARWVRKKASNGTGQVLSHVHYVDAAEGGKVDVRIRGEPVDAETLATAGLPQDMVALVVTTGVDTSMAGTSKPAGNVMVGVAAGEKQGRRKQRAAAH